MSLRAAASGAGCLLLLLSAGGCGDDPAPSGPPSAAPRGATVAVPELPATLDPARADDIAARAIAVATQTPLLTYRRATGTDAATLEPALATELPELSSDEREYRFQLRGGLVYADGRLVKASDVERGIAHASRDATDPLIREALGRIVSAPSADGETLTGVRSDDRTGTIVVRLRAPDGRVPLALADPATAPMPERPRAGEPPASTGPLQVVRRTGSVIELTANPLRPTISTVPPARLARVTLVERPPAGDRAVTAEELRTGEVDLQLAPSGSVAPPQGASRLTGPTTAIISAVLGERGALAQRATREALAAAVDRRELPAASSPILAVCGLIPSFAVGSVEREPCPDAPAGSQAPGPAAGAVLRVGAPPQSWAPAGSTLIDQAARMIGAQTERVETRDPLAALAAGEVDVALVRRSPRLPHPAAWLAPAAEVDRLLAREVPRETEGPLTGSARRWEALERRAVDRAVAIALFAPQRAVLAGPSINQRTVRLHPILGPDLAALDVR